MVPSEGPHVICSVLERTAEESARQARAAPAGCTLVEIRADHLSPAGIARVVGEAGRDVVVTIRRPEDGGAVRRDDAERRAGLRQALDAGARFVDVEWPGPLGDLVVDHPQRVIASRHGGACRAADLVAAIDAMASSGAAVLKLVPLARRVDDVLAIRQALGRSQSVGPHVALFASGGVGSLSRYLAPAWGSWATYAATARGRETAPGQPTAAELLDLYDVLGIGPGTRLFGLIGSTLSRSPSPAMHRAAYRAAGIDARYFAVESDALEPAWRLFDCSSPVLEAVGVTMPFKQAAAALCRAGDPVAGAAGSVNTVCRRNRERIGYNTDGPGALERIRRVLEPRDSRVAILGAGGTARGIAAALRAVGADVVLLHRDADRGRQAASAVGARADDPGRLGDLAWDLLVNATPQGADGQRFLDPDLLRGRLVLDAVYSPRATPLVIDARERGLAVIDGHELLAAQAVGQFERMTGVRPDYATLRAASMPRPEDQVP